MYKKLYEDVKNSINEIKIFDTHEHIMYESERRIKKIDCFIFYCPYLSADLVSAGLRLKELEKLQSPNIDLETKWGIFSPYWKLIKNTTYSKVITIAAKDIYGVESINLNSIKKISEKINEFKRVEYYRDILREKSRIEYILNDLDGVDILGIKKRDPDKDYFLPVMRVDHILELNSIEKLTKLEEENNININSFSNFINLIDEIFKKRNGKVYALKIAAAYTRNIFFEDVSYNDAEKSFLKILKLNNYDSFKDTISLSEIKPFQDYIYHYCIRKATKYGLPIQIHTGLLGGNANDIRNSIPTGSN